MFYEKLLVNIFSKYKNTNGVIKIRTNKSIVLSNIQGNGVKSDYCTILSSQLTETSKFTVDLSYEKDLSENLENIFFQIIIYYNRNFMRVITSVYPISSDIYEIWNSISMDNIIYKLYSQIHNVNKLNSSLFIHNFLMNILKSYKSISNEFLPLSLKLLPLYTVKTRHTISLPCKK